MQARSVRDGHVIVTLANYGIHAEELGFSSTHAGLAAPLVGLAALRRARRSKPATAAWP